MSMNVVYMILMYLVIRWHLKNVMQFCEHLTAFTPATLGSTSWQFVGQLVRLASLVAPSSKARSP